MKKSHKYFVVGGLTLITVAAAETVFTNLGVMFGVEQVVLTAGVGVIGGLKLLTGL